MTTLPRTWTTVVLAALASTALTVVPTTPASASTTHCVGSGPDCYATLQAAIDAAHDGDTVRVGPGTYAGGVRIAKSLELVGAGPGRTTIRGGGPVITISSTPSSTPVVRITGLTVTGGYERGGSDGAHAAGGGIFIPPAGQLQVGATVTLERVEVTRNRAEPRSTVPDTPYAVCAAGHDCRFASALGGGIASSGNLTLIDSVVSRNEVGGHASKAAGGGISSDFGSVTLDASTVSRNRVTPVGIGRTAQGGGIFVDGEAELTLLGSSVSGNRADLVTRWPGLAKISTFGVRADGGGIHAGGIYSSVRIEDSRIDDNLVSAEDPVGQPRAFDSALLTDGASLVMTRSAIRGNRVRVRGASTHADLPSGRVAEMDGQTEVSDTEVLDNRVSVTAGRGDANAGGGLLFVSYYDYSASLTRVVVEDNRVVARSRHGSAHAVAGGISNGSSLTVTDSTIRRNTVVAHGGDATATGGGVLNADENGDPLRLVLVRTQVERNLALTDRGGTASGGGVYSTAPLELQDTRIRRNQPDQCVGCPTG